MLAATEHVRVTHVIAVRSFLDGRQTGSYPETGFAEIGAREQYSAAQDFSQADFWPHFINRPRK